MIKFLRKWVRNLLGFSGREINGFLILLPLTILIIFSNPLYHWWRAGQPADFSADKKRLDSLAQLWTNSTPPPADTVRSEVFDFDPNTISVEELQRLGFSSYLSTRIATYRQKGGQFRVKKDLLKIYGLDSALFIKLQPHILLPEKIAYGSHPKEEKEIRQFKGTNRYAQSEKQPFNRFNLNEADTNVFESVYGIGSRLAKRIVKFRDALGGFVHTQQLYEVYGIDSAAVLQLQKQSFIDANFTPEKIDLNSATESQLASHPYVRKTLAKAIVAYRFQHKQFSNVDELSKLAVIKPEDIERLRPYLQVAGGSAGFN